MTRARSSCCRIDGDRRRIQALEPVRRDRARRAFRLDGELSAVRLAGADRARRMAPAVIDRSRADAGRAGVAGRSRAGPGDGGVAGAAGAAAAGRAGGRWSRCREMRDAGVVTLPLPEPKPKDEPKPVEEPEVKKTEEVGRPEQTPPAPRTTAAPRSERRDRAGAARAEPRQRRRASAAIVSWRDLVVARLQQAKRYPSSAEARREQGVVTLSFSVDRNGRVLSRSIARSSGHASLDQEVLAMIQRAQPLPPFPPAMTQPVVHLHGADPLLAARVARYSFVSAS